MTFNLFKKIRQLEIENELITNQVWNMINEHEKEIKILKDEHEAEYQQLYDKYIACHEEKNENSN